MPADSSEPYVPRCLLGALDDSRLPRLVRETLALGPRATFADLTAEMASGLDAPNRRDLESSAAVAIMKSHRLGVDACLPPRPFPFESAGLTTRTANMLVRMGAVEGGLIQPVVIAHMKAWPNLGGGAIMEVAIAYENWANNEGGAGESRSEPQGVLFDGPTMPDSLREAIAQVSRAEWATEVRPTDLRLGRLLIRLHPAATTVADLSDLLELAPRGFPAPETTSKIVEELRDLAERCLRMTVEEELDSVLIELLPDQRHRRLVVDRLGLGTRPPMTLQEAGDAAGVTRERVRQVIARLEKGLRAGGRQWTPALDRACWEIRNRDTTLASAIEARLVRLGVTSSVLPVASVIRIARLMGSELLDGLVATELQVLPEAPAEAEDVIRVAQEMVRRWGVANLDEMGVEAALDGTTDEIHGIVRQSLDRDPAAVWLDEDKSWIWFRTELESKRNRLLNGITKLTSVHPVIELSDLRAGLARHYRMQGVVPPTSVLRSLLRATGRYEVEGSSVVTIGDQAPSWGDVLGTLESALVEVMLENGCVMRGDDLRRELIEVRGLNKHSVQQYMTYSPFVQRYAPGVWGLRGAAVSPGEVEALTVRRERARVVRDWGWTSSGDPWCSYRLSEGSMAALVLSRPAGLKAHVSGRFRIVWAELSGLGDLNVQDRITGLSKLAGRMRLEPGDYVLLEFDLTGRTVSITAGDSELAERHQPE